MQDQFASNVRDDLIHAQCCAGELDRSPSALDSGNQPQALNDERAPEAPVAHSAVRLLTFGELPRRPRRRALQELGHLPGPGREVRDEVVR